MVLVIALNVIAAVAVIGGLSLALWALYRGLGNERTQATAPGTRRQRPVPATRTGYLAGSPSGRAAWTVR